jgi:septin family protein
MRQGKESKQHQLSHSTIQTLLTLDPRSFSEIVGYLERQYDDILAEESRIKRNPRFRDNRVHAMLYFIAPTGHGYV